jgi:low affinity Fe/Cu permease
VDSRLAAEARLSVERCSDATEQSLLRLGLRPNKELKMPQSKVGLTERFACAATTWTGNNAAFLLAIAVIVLWGATGPLFHYSDTWQLVINTGTSVLTFLMVFLIQRTQNKESMAMQLKINEIVAALKGASNRLISVEDLSEAELQQLHTRYVALAGENQGIESTSVDGEHTSLKAVR